MGAPPDQVGPLVHVVPPELAGLGVVEHGAPLAQGEDQGFDGSSQHLVHGRFVLLLLHGRLVHVDQRMAAVVVKVDARLLHVVPCGPDATDAGSLEPSSVSSRRNWD